MMMTTTRASSVGILAGTLLLLPAFTEAQDPPTPPGEQQQQQPVELELASFREVFEYPSFPRRNPFNALTVEGNVRFEDLSLIGIMYSDDPSASVAVLSTGGVDVAEDGTLNPIEGEAFNAKVGQQIGNTTIREIQRDRVIVDVEEFGLTDRRTMTFVSRRQGGSQ